ncbi:hypothetical protein Ddc_05964 [Ditylenchus destructor]|nr:hypothetical protein Ddc_05964 [Ditylenchus destructor]
MGYIWDCRRLLPPYYKYAIFFFCGIELTYSAFLMAINQKFWELSEKIFPSAFRMFDDTVLKGEPEDFSWDTTALLQLIMYQNKLKYMWVTSTLVVLFSMFCIVPQFCSFEEGDDEITYCVKKPAIGYVLAPMLILLVAVMGAILTWQWATCESDTQLFQTLFRQSQKEEAFLSELEQKLNCILDDDKEVESTWECDNTVDRSILNSRWLNPLFFSFFLIHAFLVLGFSLINREFGKRNRSQSISRNHHNCNIRVAQPSEGTEDNGSEALIIHNSNNNSSGGTTARTTPFKYTLQRSSSPSIS